MDEIISWIEHWSLRFSNQKVKDESNFLIRTLDNPGWEVHININGTNLENKPFTIVEVDRSDDDWLYCVVKENEFQIACGPENLIEGLLVFIKWFNKENQLENNQTFTNVSILEWLQKWYLRNCDEDWEHMFGVSIKIINPASWEVWLDIEETELEDKTIMPNSLKKAENDWLEYKIDRKRFQVFLGHCSLKNLNEVLEIFINWANANLD